MLFEIRPAGRGAPRIDPKPILDGWKLLESTAIYRAKGKNPFFGRDARTPTIGQILLMGKSELERRVAAQPAHRDLRLRPRATSAARRIDRRVLATLEFLAANGLRPTVTSLKCGHSLFTASGNVSHHSSGNAVDIAKINGIPILGHQGKGSITDIAVRRLLTLQGTMKPAQIITLMKYEGADNTFAMGDHDDHIHVGFQPMFDANSKLGRQLNAVLKPGQWIKLIDRLGEIDNPTVRVKPSQVRDHGQARPREPWPTAASSRPALPVRPVRVPVGARAGARALRDARRAPPRPSCGCSSLAVARRRGAARLPAPQAGEEGRARARAGDGARRRA